MPFWFIGLMSLIVTCAATPIVRHWLIRHGVIDHPNSRSSHRVATPRGGGVACVFGVVTTTAVAAATGHDVAWSVLAAALAMALIGLLDDRSQLPVAYRLISQILVGGLLGFWLEGPVWALVGAVVMPLAVNVVNFMDGINGITALTLTLWGVTAVFAGVAYETHALAVVGVVTAGSAVGFLPWNAPRAKVFLGDVGSYLFGALAAGGLLLGTSGAVPAPLMVAPLLVYIIDVAATLGRRALRKSALTQAHREHVYQRLVHELQVPHLLVSTCTTLIAAVIVVAWVIGPMWPAAISTLVLLSVYLASVSLWRRARPASKLNEVREA